MSVYKLVSCTVSASEEGHRPVCTISYGAQEMLLDPDVCVRTIPWKNS